MVVYQIRNKINGKLYVGQTTMPLSRRFQAHVDHARAPSRAYVSVMGNALLKYSRDAFEITVLETCATQDALNEAEKRWIEKLSTLAPLGYNLREGGGHSRMTESTKAKLSAIARARSPETLAKMSAAMKGRKLQPHQSENLVKGRARRWSPEIRASHPGTGQLNPNAILDASQVREIRSLYAQGDVSQTALAVRFGVKQVTISAITRGKTWKGL